MAQAAGRAAAHARQDGRELGAHLFTFAVIADTHVNQEDGKASSDFAVNRLSNARNRHVMHELNRAKPAFVLHLGDIVHPTPVHPGYATAAASFHALAAILKCPLYLTPGNHDVGDKPGDWLPVPSVSDAYLDLYRTHFGANYHCFDSHGCHFVVIDAQIVNSGLACEAAQAAWLEQDLAAHAGGRIFLCSHYPPFLHEPGEDRHYDNIDEPGRSWLLALLAKHRVEALFAGHVHNFWYHLRGDTEIYLLPSTAFVRLDYSELFRIEPAPERGRNDAPKLGYMLVDVHEHGHVAHAIRSYGACLAPDETPVRERRLAPVHPKLAGRTLLGVDLRHPWAETMEVAASGAMDEFTRKPARNDYPVMVLWEMGIRQLRVPIADLRNPATRERMRALARNGQAFTVYTHLVPAGALRDLLIEHADLVADWEVIAPLAGIDAVAAQVAEVKAAASLSASLSKLRRPDDPRHHGQKARHVIEHGFYLAEEDQIRALLGHGKAGEVFDGFLFRIPRETPTWTEIPAIQRLAAALGKRARTYVRLADDNPSQARDDDLANANRVAESMLAVFACGGSDLWIDALADVDRGYFPRAGLVDRRFNPRLAGQAVRNLHSALGAASCASPATHERATPFGRLLGVVGGDMHWMLALPERAGLLTSIEGPNEGLSGTVEAIDLASGRIASVAWRRTGAGEGTAELERPIEVAVPTLLRMAMPR